jgi:hypothetical protein
MPNTYTELRRTVVGTATPSVTLDLTGISGYTDLVLVCNYAKSAGARLNMNLNGDTGSNYSYTRINGNGTSASSDRIANFGIIDAGYTDTTMSNSIIQLMNYSNTTTNKTVLIRANSTFDGMGAFVALWRNTAAITSITLGGSNNLVAGSTFSLYGINAEGDSSPKATGGTVTSDSNYWYHTFPMSGRFTPNQSLTADVLVVAGGGGSGAGYTGNNRGPGGGAAGGFRTATGQSLTAQSYNVTVGGGGNGAPGGTSTAQGSKGSNSEIGRAHV